MPLWGPQRQTTEEQKEKTEKEEEKEGEAHQPIPGLDGFCSSAYFCKIGAFGMPWAQGAMQMYKNHWTGAEIAASEQHFKTRRFETS